MRAGAEARQCHCRQRRCSLLASRHGIDDRHHQGGEERQGLDAEQHRPEHRRRLEAAALERNDDAATDQGGADQRLLAGRDQGADDRRGVVHLRRAVERQVAGEDAAPHRLGDGIGHRQPGDRGADIVHHPAGHLAAVEPDRLADLEEEHRQGDEEVEGERRLDQIGAPEHADGPGDGQGDEGQLQPVGDPGQPAGQELVALRRIEPALAERHQVAPVVLQDLHRAIGPAVALLAIGLEAVRHQPAAIALLGVDRPMARLEQAQAELGILGDAPFGPAAGLRQGGLPDQRHGAVLDDGVLLVPGLHAEIEETGILPEAHPLEEVLVAVAVVLRRLHQGHLRVGEMRRQVAQPARLHQVVAVDRGDHLGLGIGDGEREVQCPRLEAGPFRQVIEAEVRLAEGLDIGLDRLPDGIVLGVVVDDQHFVVRIIQPLEGLDGVDHHLGRLVVAGHVHRDPRQLPAAGNPRRRQAPAGGAEPEIDRHLDTFDQEDRQQQQGGRRHHHQGDEIEPGQIELAVLRIDPDRGHHAAAAEDRDEQAAAAVQQQFRPHDPEREGQAQDDRRRRQVAPVLVVDELALQRRLRLAPGIPQSPIGADAAFGLRLPRLVEGLDDVVVDVALLRLDQELPHEDALRHRRGLGDARAIGAVLVLARHALARPADLADQDALVGIGALDLAVEVDGRLHRLLDRHAVPVGQDVDGEIVDGIGQLLVQQDAVAQQRALAGGLAAQLLAVEVEALANLRQLVLVAGQPDMEGLGGGDRHPGRQLHPLDIVDQLVALQVGEAPRPLLVVGDRLQLGLVRGAHQAFQPVGQQHLVADDQLVDAADPGDRGEIGDLLLVLLLVVADGGAGGDVEADLPGQLGNFRADSGRLIGADGAGPPGDQVEIRRHLLDRGLLAGERRLVAAPGRIGEAVDVAVPFVLQHRLVHREPGSGEERRHDDADQPIRKPHGRTS